MSGAIKYPDARIIEKGTISFYENEWKIEFVFDLNSFFQNANILNKCVFELKSVCEINPKVMNCKYFLEYVTLNYNLINKDITQIKKLSRQKRFWRSLQGATLVRVFTYAALGIAIIDLGIDKVLIHQQAEKTQELAEQFQKHLNLSRQTQDLYEHMFNESAVRIDQLGLEINKMHKDKLSEQKLNDILHIATLSLMQHYRDTTKFLNILSNNIRSNTFNIINVDDFLELANISNQAMLPEYHLPIFESDFTISNFINLCKITSLHNNTHLKLAIEIPIVRNNKSIISEFIPVPTFINNKTVILDSDSVHFIVDKKNNIRILPEDVLKQCIRLNDTFLCNSMLNDNFYDPDECIASYISKSKNISELCQYIEIKSQNYFIQLSDSMLFCYIIRPMSIEIMCEDSMEIHHLTNDTEIHMPECEIYKISSDHHHIGNTTIIFTPESVFPSISPEFTIVDLNDSNYFTNFSLMDRHKIQLIKLEKQAILVEEDINRLVSENSDISSGLSFQRIFKSLNIFDNTLYSTIFYICIPTIVLILINLLCKRMKNK